LTDVLIGISLSVAPTHFLHGGERWFVQTVSDFPKWLQALA